MKFIKLRRSDMSENVILINLDLVTSIEQRDGFTEVHVQDCWYQVKESVQEIFESI